MQPQGHVQVVKSTVDYGLDPQAALDAPRWYWHTGLDVTARTGVPRPTRRRPAAPRAPGAVAETGAFGIRPGDLARTRTGYVAGTEPRADGAALGMQRGSLRRGSLGVTRRRSGRADTAG